MAGYRYLSGFFTLVIAASGVLSAAYGNIAAAVDRAWSFAFSPEPAHAKLRLAGIWLTSERLRYAPIRARFVAYQRRLLERLTNPELASGAGLSLAV